MDVIKPHGITLYGGNDRYKIVLRPLSDEYLPYLYKWDSDPEVLYWSEGEDVESYSPETVHRIYGGVSQNGLCFAVEVNGDVIGSCRLQKMNLPDVIAMYPDETDVRRIDMSIGEKSYWGKGIGTVFIGMLIDFAFNAEKVDVLHCFSEDYNIRSSRVWEKNGFTRILTEEIPQPHKGKLQYHWRLTRDKYIGNRSEIPHNSGRVCGSYPDRKQAVGRVRQYIVDAFTDKVFSGNPAAVCVTEGALPDELMQAVAMENNLSETAFAVREKDMYSLRWFTPGGEIDLCGHATLATAYTIANFYEKNVDIIRFSTKSGVLTVRKNGEYFEMEFPAYQLTGTPVTSEITEALGAAPTEAYIGRDLLCVFDDEKTVR